MHKVDVNGNMQVEGDLAVRAPANFPACQTSPGQCQTQVKPGQPRAVPKPGQTRSKQGSVETRPGLLGAEGAQQRCVGNALGLKVWKCVAALTGNCGVWF